MSFRRSIVVLALALMATGCTHVPDYLVEGRLPSFGGKDPAAPKPEVAAEADAPRSAPQVVEATPPPSRAVPAPEAAPRPERSGKWRLWPQKTAKASAPTAVAPQVSPLPAPPLAGAFQTARDKSSVEAAVNYALHESPLYELRGIKSARVQVVAGANYALCLKVRQRAHEANPFHERLVAAMVFQGLDRHYELTSWQEVKTCG